MNRAYENHSSHQQVPISARRILCMVLFWVDHFNPRFLSSHLQFFPKDQAIALAPISWGFRAPPCNLRFEFPQLVQLWGFPGLVSVPEGLRIPGICSASAFLRLGL